MIAREIVDEILARTDIETLIGSYVRLRRAGSNLQGLCPFHSEKSPSFTVYTSSNSFFCFGCGAGGNAITFVRRMENLEFEDAVENLAKRVGITVTYTEDRDRGPRFSRDRFFDMNRDAARFFHQRLYDKSEEARAALSYLTEKRGLSPATLTHFGLGFAPDSFNALTDYMKKKGYTDEELTQGFLCTKSEKTGRLFDAFRNRVMFPIIDVSGNVIAFGGRVMDDSKPKYKNSSDTPVFKKSRNLFALNYARKHCEEQIILCEGYMDVIALHAAGFPCAVATLGTAITPEQVRLLSHYKTKRIVLSYDSDEAGQKATARALQLFEAVGTEVKVLKMTGAKDPDEFIKKFGKERFEELLSGSRSKFDYHMDRVFAKYDITAPQGKIEACSTLCEEIARFSSHAEREIYVLELSRRLGLSADIIRSDLQVKIKKRESAEKKEASKQLVQGITGVFDRVNPDYSRAPAVARAEEVVLGLLLLYPEHRKKAFAEDKLTEEDFYTALSRRIFAYIRDAEPEGGPDAVLPDSLFTPDEVGRMVKMKRERLALSDNGDAVYAEAVKKMRREVADKRLSETEMDIGDLDSFLSAKRSEQNSSYH